IATLARSRGLDFVALSEHNTSSHLSLLASAQARHPELLFVPSVEFTTYKGHANGFGATAYVDHKLGIAGHSIAAVQEAFAQQGALFTINHPVLDLGDSCIGCAWEHPPSASNVAAVEIATGGWSQGGFLFTENAIAFWDRLCARGVHAAAVGGSDDHRAGTGTGPTHSPIGDPTTLVFAKDLSIASLIEGIRNGRTVVKLQGPGDPMVTLDAEGRRERDTMVGEAFKLKVVVTGGAGRQVRLVHNGKARPPVAVDADPFTLEVDATAPEGGQDRWRAEVLVDDHPRTVTSHLWLARTWPDDPPPAPPAEPASCGCTHAPAPLLLAPLAIAGLLFAARARRRR
ncbi:MAG: CehA/McbA family metallohydrolase, partial [Myxococcales bacterium]